MDLETLLKRPEGKTLEFKRDLSSPQKVMRSVVAFANTSGGTLVIGVEDAGGDVLGVKEPLKAEERLANLVSDSIEPTLIPDIKIASWRQKQLILVQVHPSSLRPHFLRSAGIDAGTYVRVGSTNRQADGPMIAELQRYSRGESFDEQVISDLDLEAIDAVAASEAFQGVRVLKPADWETLGLTSRYQGKRVPTNGGILLFGVDRAARFPDAWIQAGRFSGTDRSDIIDSSEIASHPTEAIDEALAFIRRNTSRAAVIDGARRTDVYQYPQVAIREAIINAVTHADYSQQGAPIRISIFDDRLEVENPGLLPFGLTIEEIQSGISKLRNRVIGRVFHELGLIEQWGSGIQRMTKACVDAGGQPPLFEEIAARFRVTLFAERKSAPILDGRDEEILRFLKSADGGTTSQIADQIGRSTRATRDRLTAMVDMGLIVEVGSGPHDPKRRYVIADDGG